MITHTPVDQWGSADLGWAGQSCCSLYISLLYLFLILPGPGPPRYIHMVMAEMHKSKNKLKRPFFRGDKNNHSSRKKDSSERAEEWSVLREKVIIGSREVTEARNWDKPEDLMGLRIPHDSEWHLWKSNKSMKQGPEMLIISKSQEQSSCTFSRKL